MFSKKKADKLTILIRILFFLIVVTAAFLAVAVARYAYREYLISSHPRNFSQIVEKYASENDMDEYLVYAVIKTESGFEPEAVSSVGARGLMQIMPDTFEWIREYRFGGDELVYDDMFDPDDNIRYGCRLLAYHLDYYGNVDCALAAYHSVGGAVDEWLANAEYSPDGKTLGKIPVSDTAHYVDKVNKAYKTYLELYAQ
ncbi:MAG: lytic transglycosylase domain-containing protein [Oscillospiraceae bacterium]|jgi:soluble lytic murein transglycosylase|nr:lytic transglycosylase domain-containing protein [Oscillospiraceae bacterium]